MKIKKDMKNWFDPTVLFSITFFCIMLFAFDADLAETTIYNNLVIPHLKVNITIIMATISFVTVGLISVLKSSSKISIIVLLLLVRFILYFLPYFYMTGEFKIGIAYAMLQCAIAYYIGSSYKTDFSIFVKILLIFSIALAIEVFSVLVINHISIFAVDLKWYMVLPLGKSNYISCILLPIFVLVDRFYKYGRRWLMLAYTGFMFAAVVGTGSKGAMILFLGYFVYKIIRNMVISKKISRKVLVRSSAVFLVVILVIVLIIQHFHSGISNIVLKFITNNIFENRIKVYYDVVKLIFQHLLLGRSAYSYIAFDATKAHNFLLESLLQTGIIGTLIFVYVLTLLWKKVKYISDESTRFAMIGFFCIYLIQGLYEPNMFGTVSNTFFLLIVGIGCSRNAFYEKRNGRKL